MSESESEKSSDVQEAVESKVGTAAEPEAATEPDPDAEYISRARIIVMEDLLVNLNYANAQREEIKTI